MRNYLLKYADILAWCLMPNHFHIMLVPNEEAVKKVGSKYLPELQVLSKQIGTLLSSYSKAFNKQNKSKGSLFAHKTEAKILNFAKNNYIETCFKYIHQNPIKAKLVTKLNDWEFSSFVDYAGLRQGNMVNKQYIYDTLHFDKDNFIEWSSDKSSDDDIKNIF